MRRKSVVKGIAAGWILMVGTASAGTATYYASSFEGTDGGWTRDASWDPNGDWERGVPTLGPFPSCSFGNGPGMAFDGQECWATQIDACYTNANGTSFLRQTFDFTTVVNGTFEWRQFRHVFVQPGDMGRVLINGDLVYELPFLNTPSEGWELISIDLTPYNGLSSVEIVFEFFATTSTNAPGWFLDDMRITSLVTPNPGDVGLLVSDQPDPVTTVGDPIVYSVSAINHGDSTASHVVVNGTLDVDTVFNAALTDPAVVHDGAPSGGTISIDVGDMTAFSVRTFPVSVNTTQLGTASASFTVTYTGADPNPSNNMDKESTTTALIPDLIAELVSDQDPVVTGTPFFYTLTITNAGPSAATNVSWALSLPGQVVFQSSTDGSHDGTPTGGTVSGVLALLGAGAIHSVNVTVLPTELSELVSDASVSTTSPDENDPDPTNNMVALTIRQVSSAAPFANPIFASQGLDPAVPGSPPGLPDRGLAVFERPQVSPNGQIWGFVGHLSSLTPDNNQVIVLVTSTGAQTVIYENVTPWPDVPGESVGDIGSKFSINDAGCYAFIADSDPGGKDVVAKGCGINLAGTGTLAVIARLDNVIPGDPLNRQFILPLREPQLDNNGVVRFIVRKLITGSPLVINTFLFESPDDGQTIIQGIQTGVTIPTNQVGGGGLPWESWDQEFGTQRTGLLVTGDGLHTLLRGDLTGAGTTDDILAFDNNIVLQEGVAADPGFASLAADPALGLDLAPNGDWYARGRNADGQEWVIRNGTVVAKSGDPIVPGDTEVWATTGATPRFTVVAGDASGSFLIGGATNVNPNGVLVYQPSVTPRGTGTARVVARAGDPVDTDGDGKFNNMVTIFRFILDGTILLADGTAVASVFVEHPVPTFPRIDAGRGPEVDGGAGGGPRTITSLSAMLARIPLIASGACCFDDSRRTAAGIIECEDDHTPESCTGFGGVFRGPGSKCAGDLDDNGVDDNCERCFRSTTDWAGGCDDNDPCTEDLCDPDGFCIHVPRECDDGVDCTTDICNSTTGQCEFDDSLCNFCLFRVSCVDGNCAGCSVDLMDEVCIEQRVTSCAVGTCQGAYRTSCGGTGCCVELEPVGCGLPAGRPVCPDFTADCTCAPQQGACCRQDGGCDIRFESNCTDGTYLGDGTQCGPTQACCDGDLQCMDRPQACCENEGKPSFPTPCGNDFEDCESFGVCVPDANLTCCNRPFVACCLPDGRCADMTNACCQDAGGTPLIGESCSAPAACCFGDLGCTNLDPACCRAQGGRPMSGEQCTQPERCCSFSGCSDVDPLCCGSPISFPAGPGVCTAPQACCDLVFAPGCFMDEPTCCADTGGRAHPGMTCGAVDACCLPDGSCAMLEPFCCVDYGGTVQTGETCTQPEACCTSSGCFDLDPVCCNQISGLPTGPGMCDPDEACCLAGPVPCVDDDPACCIAFWNGSVVGSGLFCTINGSCPVPGEEACCFGDGTCQDLIPTLCQNQSATPGGVGSQCKGDINGDGEDDVCRLPGDADGDGTLTCDDVATQVDCLDQAGPALPIPAAGACPFTNMNGDQTLDLKDFSELQRRVNEGCGLTP